MTLFRHITWLVLFFSFVIQVGSASLFIWHGQTMITKNIENQSRNTAEFIINSLSVSQDALSAGFKAVLETNNSDSISKASTASSHENLLTLHEQKTVKQLTDPLIESGEFHGITILKNNIPVYTQQLPLIINAVPNWFDKRFGFQHDAAQVSKIIKGQEYTVSVEMNREKAIYSLYRTVKNAARWVFIGLIATGIALYFSLKKLLAPLSEVEAHAKAISNKQFDHQIPMPDTRELQQVVVAMNTMSNRLQMLFNEQLNAIQDARILAYEDRLTQLPNVAAFENYIKMLANIQEDHKKGFIVLCKIEGLEATNRKRGRQQTDVYLKDFAQIWQTMWSCVNSSVARRNSSEFLAWIETENYAQVRKIIHNIDIEFKVQSSNRQPQSKLQVHMGMHYFDTKQGLAKWSNICQTLEQNIQFAIHQQSLSIGPDYKSTDHWAQETLEHIIPHSDINRVLAQAIAEKNIVLEFQPVCFFKNTATTMIDDFAECFMRMPYEDKLLTGAQIWPSIDQLQLTYAFDRLVIQMSLIHLNANPSQKLSINVCDATLDNPQFCSWLETTLKHYPDLVEHVYLEVRESFLQYEDSINSLIRLKSIGISLILDRVIAQKNTIDQFVRLPISALKMNINFLRRSYKNHDLDPDNTDSVQECRPTNEHHQHTFITNLITLCRSCDVNVIVDGVETEADAQLAKTLKATGIQGYLVSPPLDSCKAFQLPPSIINS